MKSLVRKEIANALEALRAEGWTLPATLDIPLDKPKRAEHGDLATNLAMLVSKAAGRKPVEVAQALREKLTSREDGYIAAAEIAGPGFLNLRVRDTAYHAVMQNVLAANERYGSQPLRRPDHKVLIEFVSANPTGPMHLGHARGAVVGDALVRVMRASGENVATEYYINDAGQQVINLAWTVRLLANNQPLWIDGYHGAYVRPLIDRVRASHPELLAEAQAIAPLSEDDHKKQLDMIRREKAREPTETEVIETSFRPVSMPKDRDLALVCAGYVMEGVRATLNNLGVAFDVFTSERTMVASGEVEALVRDWLANGLAVERDGAVFFKVSEATTENDKDRVLRKSNQDLTYFASDVAYHRANPRASFPR